jgi:hypothetical protein
MSRLGLSGVTFVLVASAAMAQPGLDLLTGSTLTSPLNYLNGAGNVLIKGINPGTSTSAGAFPTVGSTQTIAFAATPIIRASILGLGFGAATDTPTLLIQLLGAGATSVMPTMNASYDPLNPPELTYTQAGTTQFSATSGGNTYLYSVSGLSGSATQGAPAPTTVNLNNISGTVTYLGVIPEPATLTLLGTGLLAGGVLRRRRLIK